MFGTYVHRPSAADPEEEEEEGEEEEVEGEKEESKNSFSRGDNSFDSIGPPNPRRSRPKPKAPYHNWYNQDIKNLPDGRKRNEKAKIAVESLTKVMDEHKVSSGDKIFAEIKKEEFDVKYKKTSYFKNFELISRYIYFS